MKINSLRKYTAFFLSFIFASLAFAQTAKMSYNGSGNYTLRERTDLRRYDNGKYVGLVSREVTSFIIPVDFSNGYKYEGSFFVQQDTVRAHNTVGLGIRDSIPSTFKISDDGQLTMLVDNGYPSFRSFPSFTTKSVKPGDTWQAKAERAVDPLNKGIVTKMPIYVQYTYKGDEVFHGEPVYLLTAQWATRYGMGSGTSYIDWGGDKQLEKATGSHNATIYVSKASGTALVVRDSVDETFFYANGNQITFKGTISLFTEYPPSVDTSDLIPLIQRVAKLTDDETAAISAPIDENQILSSIGTVASATSGTGSSANSATSFPASSSAASNRGAARENWEPVNTSEWVGPNNARPQKPSSSSIATKDDIKIEQTPAGIRFTIENLQFKSNSAELLNGEESRLDMIAEILREAQSKGAQFLIEGHTASTGNPKGEMELSIERSHTISSELLKRNIDPSKIICKGSGGTKPVADNSTPEGKAKNRRVEITIL